MPLDSRTSFPAEFAYVIKLRRDSDPRCGSWHGRVEHVTSGRQYEFAAGSELLERIAADLQEMTRQDETRIPSAPTRSFD